MCEVEGKGHSRLQTPGLWRREAERGGVEKENGKSMFLEKVTLIIFEQTLLNELLAYS